MLLHWGLGDGVKDVTQLLPGLFCRCWKRNRRDFLLPRCKPRTLTRVRMGPSPTH